MHKKNIIHSLLLMITCLAPAQDGQAGSTTANVPKSQTVARQAPQDLPNFHKVHPYLYRSGEPSQRGLYELQKLGVKTIIDLRNPGEKKFDEVKAARQLGMTVINLPMSSKPPTRGQVDRLLSTISLAKQDRSRGAVLVHCAHGSDRTGCMVGIWRVTQDGHTYDAAYKEMRKYYFTPKFTRLADAVRQQANKTASTPTR